MYIFLNRDNIITMKILYIFILIFCCKKCLNFLHMNIIKIGQNSRFTRQINSRIHEFPSSLDSIATCYMSNSRIFCSNYIQHIISAQTNTPQLSEIRCWISPHNIIAAGDICVASKHLSVTNASRVANRIMSV